ncbi:hypothetical protein [Acerihabitans sp.]|uniref:hypothetical protein n=1 Tax=Acerihabitans sp. TaxID=2811394 RepID=UPI002ED8E3D7
MIKLVYHLIYMLVCKSYAKGKFIDLSGFIQKKRGHALALCTYCAGGAPYFGAIKAGKTGMMA